MAEGKYDKIVELLKKKVTLKQEVYSKTRDVFEELRTMLMEISSDLTNRVKNFGGDLTVTFKDASEFEVEFTLADATVRMKYGSRSMSSRIRIMPIAEKYLYTIF